MWKHPNMYRLNSYRDGRRYSKGALTFYKERQAFLKKITLKKIQNRDNVRNCKKQVFKKKYFNPLSIEIVINKYRIDQWNHFEIIFKLRLEPLSLSLLHIRNKT